MVGYSPIIHRLFSHYLLVIRWLFASYSLIIRQLFAPYTFVNWLLLVGYSPIIRRFICWLFADNSPVANSTCVIQQLHARDHASAFPNQPKINFLKWILSSIWEFPYYQYQCVSKRPKINFLKRILRSIWAFPYYQNQCVSKRKKRLFKTNFK